MKKVMSIILTCFLTLTLMAPMSTVFAWEASATDADLYVGIMSDAHVSAGTTGSVTAALNAFNTMAGGAENLDGLALVGDMVYNSNSTTVNPAHYTALYSAIDATNADTPIAYAMGNHEYPLSETTSEDVLAPAREAFVTATGQELLYHTTFGDAESNKDYHFIAAHPDNYNGAHSTETENWMMAEIDKAIASDSTNATGETFAAGVTPNSTKPVFVLLHHPIEGTAGRATTDYYSDEFIAYLKTRPQVIVFTGHRHLSYRRAEMMWQDGFTVFMVPLLSNSTVSAIGHNAFDTTVNEHGATMLEVKDGVVSLQVFDVSSNELIGDPWVIDIPNMVADRTDSDATNDNDHYTWSPDKRANVVAPAFPEDAKVKVTLNDRTATVSFKDSAIPTETPNQRDGIVFAYRVALYNDAGTLLSTKIPATKYYSSTYTAAPGTAMSSVFTGLEYNKEYTVKVFPLAPFATGESIETVFETETVTYGTPIIYEAEDYAARETDVTTHANASGEGNKYIYVYATPDDPSISIPVTIETAGYYDIQYALGQDTTGGYTSNVTASITNSEGTVTTLGTSSKSSTYAKDLCTNGNWPSGSVRMRLFEKQYMYLEAGTYTVDFKATAISTGPNKNKYMCAYDYVSFTQVIKPNAANETYYEGENYLTARVYASSTATEYTEKTGTKTSNASFHDGAYANSNFSGNYKAEIDVPVTVDEAGKYYLTFKTICNQSYRVSKTTLTLEGSVIFTTTPAGEAKDFWQTWEFPVNLKKGTNTITITSYKAGSNKNVYAFWDYIKISDKATEPYVEKITKDRTIIQAEDYQIYRIKSGAWYPSTNWVVSDATSSGGAYVDSVYENPTGTKYLDIPVKIYNYGYYTITPRLKDSKTESGYVLYVDGTKVATLSSTSQALGWFETGTKVLLSEGEHLISVRSAGGSNHCRLVADSVTLTYDNPKVTVPAAGKLIEAESNPLLKTYLKTTTTATSEVTETEGLVATGTTATDDAASGKSKIVYNYYKANGDTVSYSQKATWEQPISVEKAGKYVITYTVNQSADYHARIYALLDGEVLEQAAGVGTGTPGLTTITYLKDLTAGDHTIAVRADRFYNANCTLVVDCVNIEPLETAFDAVSVNDDKTSMVELETYKDSMFVGNTGKLYTSANRVAESTDFSGEKALFSDYQNTSSPSSVYVTFPINVTAAGKYDVEFSVTGVEDYRSGGITLYIDDVAKQTSNHAGYTTLKTYELDSVSLTEGVHMVKLEITRRYNSNAHGTLDYIKFMPNEEITYDSATGKASAAINVDTIGAVIIALYDADEKVCGVYTETITEAKSVKASDIVCAKTPVTCKVFVWEDLINVKPLIDARTITIE